MGMKHDQEAIDGALARLICCVVSKKYSAKDFARDFGMVKAAFKRAGAAEGLAKALKVYAFNETVVKGPFVLEGVPAEHFGVIDSGSRAKQALKRWEEIDNAD